VWGVCACSCQSTKHHSLAEQADDARQVGQAARAQQWADVAL